jgi:RNA polymerase sigma-70 factor, ECF subfamily
MKKDFKNISDLELCNILSQNDEKARLAFEEIYSRYSTKIYTYCKKILLIEETAQDIFQETFVKFYEYTKVNRNMTNVPGFLTKIARNLCLNEKKRNSVKLVSFDDVINPPFTEMESGSELSNLIDAGLEMIPEEYREILILKEVIGFSYTEIADIMNISNAVVRTKIWRAKNRLRKILAPNLEHFQE